VLKWEHLGLALQMSLLRHILAKVMSALMAYAQSPYSCINITVHVPSSFPSDSCDRRFDVFRDLIPVCISAMSRYKVPSYVMVAIYFSSDLLASHYETYITGTILEVHEGTRWTQAKGASVERKDHASLTHINTL
jgi:hypothetical protein